MVDLFGEKSFAVVFIVLMALPALPLPRGGVTHVFEVIMMLLALELIVGRRTVWLPERWKRRELGGTSGGRFARALMRQIRWFERFSRPRLPWLLRQRLNRVVLGVIVFALSLTAFLAPPFSGLDTLPAMGVVVLALGVLLEDFILVVVGAPRRGPGRGAGGRAGQHRRSLAGEPVLGVRRPVQRRELPLRAEQRQRARLIPRPPAARLSCREIHRQRPSGSEATAT